MNGKFMLAARQIGKNTTILMRCAIDKSHKCGAHGNSINRYDTRNTALEEAEKVVGYPTSLLNLRWLLSDELANMGLHLRKLVGTRHPLLDTIRNLFIQNDMPAWGLLVLLVSKAAGLKRDFLESELDASAGVLYKQRALAEIAEMVRKSILIHKGLLNFRPTDEDAHDLNFGNKMALLCGDYLLCKSYQELAGLRNQEVNELISSALRDLVDAEFIGPRDEQNNPLPAQPRVPHEEVSTMDVLKSNVSPMNAENMLGIAKSEWILRNCLGGGNLLGRACQGWFILAGHVENQQEDAFHFGRQLALAWQAYIDINNFISGRFDRYSLTSAPVIFHLQHDPAVYEKIMCSLDNVEDVKYGDLYNELSAGPGLNRTKELQKELCVSLINMLDIFPVQDARIALNNIINMLSK